MRGAPTQCPYCRRTVSTDTNRYVVHSIQPATARRCPLSDQRVVITGLADADYERRAWTALDLAEQIQDYDPALVWAYLSALPADELRRLLVIALAGLPVDQHPEQIWTWVYRLPVAQQWVYPEPQELSA